MTLVLTVQDRRQADQRLRNEHLRQRRILQEQQACDVYVVRSPATRRRWSRPEPASATVVNGGDYPIMQVTIMFVVGGQLEDPARTEFVAPPEASAVAGRGEVLGQPDVLTPGAGMRATMACHRPVLEPVPIVRWVDRWEQCWEYRAGVAHRFDQTHKPAPEPGQ